MQVAIFLTNPYAKYLLIRPTTPFTTLLPANYATLDDHLTISTRFIRPKWSKGRYIGTEERTPCAWQGRSLRLLDSVYRYKLWLISQMQQSYATENHVGCQHDWIHIVFFVIDDEANGKDAAMGVVADAVPDDTTAQMCQVSGEDSWWYDLYDRRGDEDVEQRRRMHWKSWKRNMIVTFLIHERKIWSLI